MEPHSGSGGGGSPIGAAPLGPPAVPHPGPGSTPGSTGRGGEGGGGSIPGPSHPTKGGGVMVGVEGAPPHPDPPPHPSFSPLPPSSRRHERGGAGARARGRDAGDREGPGGRRSVEADPAEHVHAVVQRAPEVRAETSGQPADRPGRRAEAHRAARGAEPEEARPEVQRPAHVPADAARERVGGPRLLGEREYQVGVHR